MVKRAKDRRIVHVYPRGDMRQHQTTSSGHCWCTPRIERVTTTSVLISHNALDGRELIERHGLQ